MLSVCVWVRACVLCWCVSVCVSLVCGVYRSEIFRTDTDASSQCRVCVCVCAVLLCLCLSVSVFSVGLTRGLLCTNRSSLYCPPPLHCPRYCNTFAWLLRTIRPLPPPSQPPLYATHHTILVMAIACKGHQGGH